jgi:hypothetical protein
MAVAVSMNPVRTRPSEAAASPPFFELEAISKRYGGVQALSGVDLALRAGEGRTAPANRP